MNPHEYRLVAMGWTILIIFLTMFWYATLKRLSGLLSEHMVRSGRKLDSIMSVFVFLFRGEFKSTGDARLIGVCKRLRSLLYGYLGSVGAYIVFLMVFRPRF